MRIAWCTPLDPASGIAKYSAAVLPHLGELADVVVFAPASADAYAVDATVRELVPATAEADLSGFDAVVYNTGNNPAFHAEIHHASAHVPGIVIVHDKRMHGFFHDLWAVHDGDPERYAAMMRYYYGEAGESAAADVLTGRAGVDSRPEFPLVEPALFNATGIVVHSAESAALVRRYGDLVPVVTLGLPFDPAFLDALGPLPARDELVADDGRVLVVSSGGVFEQKRLDSVVRAIAGDVRLRDAVRLAIVGGGRPEYLESLRALAAQLGIGDAVRITGRVDDREMYGWIAAADIAVNLRYPSMESSSLSLVEQLFLGKPLIVTDTSYYAELPDDVAIKVPVDAESTALPAALAALVGDGARRASMGTAASAFARSAHDPGVYARAIVELARMTREGAR